MAAKSKKKSFKIFLTWQNDVPQKTNKNYIEDCVDYVVKKINKFAGKNIFLSPCLGGASGGNFNPIETTLMREIMDADIFFADLTSTERFDKKGNRKFHLNANVAYETGIFLGKKKGKLNDCLIAVNNEAWVPASNSPFDFRGRSQILYKRDESLKGTELARCTSMLKRDINTALSRFLETNKVNYVPSNKGNMTCLRKILMTLSLKKVKSIIAYGKKWILPSFAFNLNDNFYLIYQKIANKITDREIKDALDSFSDAFGHLFDYGCCFFPDMIDAYFCPETHRASCDYQNAIKKLEDAEIVLYKQLLKYFNQKQLDVFDRKAADALEEEIQEEREKYGIKR